MNSMFCKELEDIQFNVNVGIDGGTDGRTDCHITEILNVTLSDDTRCVIA